MVVIFHTCESWSEIPQIDTKSCNKLYPPFSIQLEAEEWSKSNVIHDLSLFWAMPPLLIVPKAIKRLSAAKFLENISLYVFDL